MKKTISVIGLLLIASLGVMAQKQVKFTMKVAPNKDYAMLMKMNMNMVMDVSGDTAMASQMKKASQSFPMVMNMDMGINGDVKTSAPNADKQVPFIMVVKSLPVKMQMNGKDTPIPMPATNETMYGTYSPEGKMTVDSIAGKKADDATKAAMVGMVNSMQAAIKFPEIPMKVGDTFTQDMPLNLPMGGVGSGKMNAKVTYKLTLIESGKAYFDLIYDITMDMGAAAGMKLNMTGGGDGKMTYDIANSYPTVSHNNMNINYTMNMPQAPNMTMTGKMKMLMDIQTTISNK